MFYGCYLFRDSQILPAHCDSIIISDLNQVVHKMRGAIYIKQCFGGTRVIELENTNTARALDLLNSPNDIPFSVGLAAGLADELPHVVRAEDIDFSAIGLRIRDTRDLDTIIDEDEGENAEACKMFNIFELKKVPGTIREKMDKSIKAVFVPKSIVVKVPKSGNYSIVGQVMTLKYVTPVPILAGVSDNEDCVGIPKHQNENFPDDETDSEKRDGSGGIDSGVANTSGSN